MTASSQAIVIERASAQDIEAIKRLLSAAALPLAGVTDQFPAAFAVARCGAAIVGTAALERYDGACLLRSVAVAAGFDRRGLGAALVRDRVQLADAAPVYLLTTTARAYFERLGFVPASRHDVPEALAASPEFASACPASATCLVLRGP